jgi:hypothetical protein
MFCSLANGNDTDLVTALCMRHGYDLVLQKPQRQEAVFTVRFAVVLRRKCEPLKDLRRVHEIDAVLAEICPSLGLVPREYDAL